VRASRNDRNGVPAVDRSCVRTVKRSGLRRLASAAAAAAPPAPACAAAAHAAAAAAGPPPAPSTAAADTAAPKGGTMRQMPYSAATRAWMPRM